MLAAPTAGAVPRPPGRAGGRAVVGHIAYLTAAGQVLAATVHRNGTTTGTGAIGPALNASKGHTIRVSDLLASSDGKWLGWSETDSTNGGGSLRIVAVLHNVRSGTDETIETGQYPIGFAGDTLITTGASHSKKLVLTPTPHLVDLPGHQAGLSAYPHGVVDAPSIFTATSDRHTDSLRLSSFGGQHKALHRYRLGPTNYRDVDAAWVSGDGRRLVIERGNHQDFAGLGPSSLADEYSLGGSHRRGPLGHYGTAKAAWRIQSVTYTGKADVVTAVWYRAHGHKRSNLAESVVAQFTNGAWHRIVAHGVAAAGDRAGYLIVQPGRWVQGRLDEEVDVKPVGDSLLMKGSGVPAVLDATGTAFAWINPPALGRPSSGRPGVR
jgi:hypothetical protein